MNDHPPPKTGIPPASAPANAADPTPPAPSAPLQLQQREQLVQKAQRQALLRDDPLLANLEIGEADLFNLVHHTAHELEKEWARGGTLNDGSVARKADFLLRVRREITHSQRVRRSFTARDGHPGR
ncbi:hypothetical protein AYO44_01455 [Planctomycetaceae bacterium SCGC AG-212-F19]|nr:hypothetical protein AYO44_01455 [Planctomycetaceae bacterium SCGC AG-212-F19]